ncbi:MAG: S8 family serine peptidase [Micrococcales bacterium]|nr:S8 family serine peptidase [Micrococcales bacterium]
MGYTRAARLRSLLAGTAVAALVGSALTLGAAGAATAAPALDTGLGLGIQKPGATSYTPGRYVVTLRQHPAATYTGGVSGLAATKPAVGRQLRAESAPVEKYTDYLGAEQKKVAAAVGAKIDYSYRLALNGFSSQLSAAQAAKLAADKDVAAVTLDEKLQVQAQSGVQFLGLDGENGVWSKVGGVQNAGKGVVVGVLDTGIAPENPSFAGAKLGTSAGADPYLNGSTITYAKGDGGTFTGVCQRGVQFTASDCSTKIVGARYYVTGFGAGNIAPVSGGEYLSPRDGDAHGSHTASTAVGNAGVKATVEGRDFGQIAGVAPAAKVAAYKVCWTGDPAQAVADGCATSDMVAAINQAVADGVDVLNFSIGGGAAQTTVSATDQAFLGAAAAGIFVSASAGNAGPGATTLDNAAPWETTVAASTIPGYEATVTLGNGQKYAGASVTVDAPVTGDLVRADQVAAPGVADAVLCGPNSLDAAKVAGKIVWCQRGVYDRVAKSAEVKRAGGIGMILVNATPNSVDSDSHSVPTVHLNAQYYRATFDYAGTAGATATLTPENSTGVTVPVPQVASFSSRGPVEADGSDILKPDIAAPGVGVLAAGANPAGGTPTWEFLSGTSMAAPHIAGLAALYLGVKPTASPMEIKSAMMTSAYDTVDENGARVSDPFAQGAGQVEARKFLDPGLVYLSGTQDWLSYIVGAGYTLSDPSVEAIDPSDLNLASISIGSLTGTQTVTRTVTSTRAGQFVAQPVAMKGVRATVSPKRLNFTAAGQSKSYTVTFSRTTAKLDAFTTGYLRWVGGDTIVRSPLAVRPVTVLAPNAVSGSGLSGSTKVDVTPGFTGSLPLNLTGLTPGTKLVDPAGSSPDRSGSGTAGATFSWEVAVPAGTSFARFDEKAVNQDADLDLTVELLDKPGGTPQVGYQSATGSADERVDIPAPDAGTYRVTVAVFSGTSAFDLTTFVVPASGGVGSFTATPNPLPATQGTPTSYTLSWAGLTPRTQYLGVVGYGTSSARTVLQVDAGEPPAPVATVAPAISGTPQVGRTLTASSGTWDVQGLSFAYQWQVDGADVPGATGSSYTVRSNDQGKAVTVRVTASTAGLPDGTATSAPVTVKYVAKVTQRLSTPVAFSSQRVQVDIAVTTGTTTPPTGTVAVRVNGRTVSGTLDAEGMATVKLPRLRSGIYTVTTTYLGSETVAPATSGRKYLVVLF